MTLYSVVIVPSASAEAARAAAASVWGCDPAHVFQRELSPDGTAPATHYAQSGFIEEQTAAQFQAFSEAVEGAVFYRYDKWDSTGVLLATNGGLAVGSPLDIAALLADVGLQIVPEPPDPAPEPVLGGATSDAAPAPKRKKRSRKAKA